MTATGDVVNPLALALRRLGFGLLLAAIFAHAWFAGAPGPFGGPNVLLAGAAALASLLSLVASWRRPGSGAPMFPGATVLRELRPIGPVLGAGGLMLVWAVVVCLMNDTEATHLLAKMALGLAVLLAVFICVETRHHAVALAAALVLAAAGSALYGMGMIWGGESLRDAWLRVSAASVAHGLGYADGTTGLAAHPATFALELAVAIPLAFVALLEPFGGRRGVRWCIRAATFALLVAMVVMLLVNGNRSGGVGAVCGVLVVAWLYRADAAARRRLVVAVALVSPCAVWLLSPWSGNPSTRPAQLLDRDTGVVDLALGGQSESGSDRLWHRFEGYVPGGQYRFRLQRYPIGSRWTQMSAAADAGGGFSLSWRGANGQDSVYRFQSWELPTGDPSWSRTSIFKPSKAWATRRYGLCGSERGADSDPRLAISRLRTTKDALWHGDARVVGTDIYLPPATPHMIQLRACDAHGFGPVVETEATAKLDAVVRLTLLPPTTANPVAYQIRARSLTHARWHRWAQFRPVHQARGPAFGTIAFDSRALAFGERQAVGHRFAGLVNWQQYVVQVRARHRHGHTTPSQAFARPDTAGVLTLVWAVPDNIESLGYQFRMRMLSNPEWSPWSDFTPTLSSVAPALVVLPEGAEADLATGRHTLSGLPPGIAHLLQLRAWNRHGYGPATTDFVRTADALGTMPLAWRHARATAELPASYQFRIWLPDEFRWGPWRDFTTNSAHRGRGSVAHERERSNTPFTLVAGELGPGRLAAHPRMWRADLIHTALRSRAQQALVALGHARAHPFGTGAYHPSGPQLAEPAVPRRGRRYQSQAMMTPHNQFLHMLVRFGVPGLALYLTFYALLIRQLAPCRRAAIRFPFPAIGVLGAWAAYTIASLALPKGPLLHGWDHFFLLGLLFAPGTLASAPRTKPGGRQA